VPDCRIGVGVDADDMHRGGLLTHCTDTILTGYPVMLCNGGTPS
jgi:hypothetical protein